MFHQGAWPFVKSFVSTRKENIERPVGRRETNFRPRNTRRDVSRKATSYNVAARKHSYFVGWRRTQAERKRPPRRRGTDEKSASFHAIPFAYRFATSCARNSGPLLGLFMRSRFLRAVCRGLGKNVIYSYGEWRSEEVRFCKLCLLFRDISNFYARVKIFYSRCSVPRIYSSRKSFHLIIMWDDRM